MLKSIIAINQIEFINCNLAGELKFYDIIVTNPHLIFLN